MTQTITPEQWLALSIEERHEIERNTLFSHLEKAGKEAAQSLVDRLEAGQVDGNHYWDEDTACGCVLGTLFRDKVDLDDDDNYLYELIEDYLDVEAVWENVSKFDRIDFRNPLYNDAREAGFNSSLDPIEGLAYNVRPGATPENNENAKLIHQWTKEWIDAN